MQAEAMQAESMQAEAMHEQLTDPWEQALASWEDSAARAEELLAGRGSVDPEEVAASLNPGLGLPRLGPLPAALRERARNLHARQLRVQEELATAMTTVRGQLRTMSVAAASVGGPAPVTPRYLDRRV